MVIVQLRPSNDFFTQLQDFFVVKMASMGILSLLTGLKVLHGLSEQCGHSVCQLDFGIDNGLLDTLFPVAAELLFIFGLFVGVNY